MGSKLDIHKNEDMWGVMKRKKTMVGDQRIVVDILLGIRKNKEWGA